MAKKNQKKFYVVFEGTKTGIFKTWAQCEAQVKGVSGAKFKSYPTLQEAEQAFADKEVATKPKKPKKTTPVVSKEDTNPNLPLHYLACDASFLGNDKKLEYRVVEVFGNDVTEVHRSDIFIGGSANVGEFCALLDTVVWAIKNGKQDLPIYSDSRNAQKWVSQRKTNSNVEMSEKLEKHFTARSEALVAGKYDKYLAQVEIRDWKTKVWGLEIPADFGRKGGGSGTSLQKKSYTARFTKNKSAKGRFK